MENKPRSRPTKEELAGLTEQEAYDLKSRYWREYQRWYREEVTNKDPVQREKYLERMREQYRRRRDTPEKVAAFRKARRDKYEKLPSAPGEAHPELARRNQRKHKYGLTHEQFEQMKERQNGVCAICKQPETHVKRGRVCELSVDHNHDTGEVRGLLCNNCNRALGFFKDDAKLLGEAAKYRENFS